MFHARTAALRTPMVDHGFPPKDANDNMSLAASDGGKGLHLPKVPHGRRLRDPSGSIRMFDERRSARRGALRREQQGDPHELVGDRQLLCVVQRDIRKAPNVVDIAQRGGTSRTSRDSGKRATDQVSQGGAAMTAFATRLATWSR